MFRMSHPVTADNADTNTTFPTPTESPGRSPGKGARTGARTGADTPTGILAAVQTDSLWSMLGHQWLRHLAARNLSAKTQRNYARTLVKFAAFAISHDTYGTDDPEEVSTQLVEDFFATQLGRTSARGRTLSSSSVATDYRHLRVFFNWLATAEDIPSPMATTKAPKVEERLPDIFTDEELKALVAAARGRGFTERRDTAILRLLLDTGIRRGEVAGMKVEDLDQVEQVLTVIGKGDRERRIPYGAKTAEAIDSYLRVRAKYPRISDRKRPQMWLSNPDNHNGPLGAEGVRLMVERRARIAGVPNAHPHRFRHTAAHHFLLNGGSEGDAMRLFGWKSRVMVDRYGGAAAGARAVAAARKMSAGDRI